MGVLAPYDGGTAAVGFDILIELPAGLVAVTETANAWPASAALTV